MLQASLAPLISSTTSQSLDLGNVTNALRFRKDQTLSDLATQVQQWADGITGVLQTSTPTLQQLQVIDPNGKLIAWIGDFAINNVLYSGGYFTQLYVGGTDPSNAPLFANNTGNVIIGLNGSVSIQDQTGTEKGFLGYRQESVSYSISNITNAGPPIVTTTMPHGYVNGDTVTIKNCNIAAYNGNWVITVLSTTTFFLDSGSGAGVGTTGTVTRYFAGIWGEVGAFGGTNPFNAILKIQSDGSIELTNAALTDTSSTLIVSINATSGVSVQGLSSGTSTGISGTGLSSTNTLGTFAVVRPDLVQVGDSTATQVTLNSSGVNSKAGYAANNVTVIDTNQNAFFATLAINGSALTVDGSGNLTTSGVVSANGYKAGGSTGVSGSATVINTILTQTIQYKDWTSTNQSITVVTGFTIKSLASVDGIVTTLS